MTDDIFRYAQLLVSDDRRTAWFEYEIQQANETQRLREALTFPVALLDTPQQRASLRALHLALGVSYYKIFMPPVIEQPYAMDAAEAAFWNDIWRNGLGEFLYVNKLPADRLGSFSVQPGIDFPLDSSDEQPNGGALLGIGGGKDSIVGGELLKAAGIAVEGFVMATGEQRGQAQAVADTMGVPLHIVNRVLDTQLLELQERPGAYKGHIPISLIFGLVGTALAIAAGKQYVVVANESSASIPRVTWLDASVNHQWSKSFGFERQLQHFIRTDISPSITYFSAVRQLTSVGVAKLFTTDPRYFEVFTSDNFVFRIDPSKRPSARWSLESPKSLSSFILLAPWLSEADMLRIFDLNFLDEASLESLFLELTGQQGHPPLDCVGTVEELVLSLNLTAQQNKFSDTTLMKLAHERGTIVDKDWQAELTAMLQLQEQALPSDLVSTITDMLTKELQA